MSAKIRSMNPRRRKAAIKKALSKFIGKPNSEQNREQITKILSSLLG